MKEWLNQAKRLVVSDYITVNIILQPPHPTLCPASAPAPSETNLSVKVDPQSFERQCTYSHLPSPVKQTSSGGWCALLCTHPSGGGAQKPVRVYSLKIENPQYERH